MKLNLITVKNLPLLGAGAVALGLATWTVVGVANQSTARTSGDEVVLELFTGFLWSAILGAMAGAVAWAVLHYIQKLRR